MAISTERQASAALLILDCRVSPEHGTDVVVVAVAVEVPQHPVVPLHSTEPIEIRFAAEARSDAALGPLVRSVVVVFCRVVRLPFPYPPSPPLFLWRP